MKPFHIAIVVAFILGVLATNVYITFSSINTDEKKVPTLILTENVAMTGHLDLSEKVNLTIPPPGSKINKANSEDVTIIEGNTYPTASITAMYGFAKTLYPELKTKEVKAIILISRNVDNTIDKKRFLFFLDEYTSGRFSQSILSLSSRIRETHNFKLIDKAKIIDKK
jgi:hypothetical protein